MDVCRLPKEFQFEGSLPEKWKKWKQSFQFFMMASGKTEDKDEGKKIAILLNLIGEKGQEIFNTFKLDLKSATLDAVIKRFDDYCEPRKNVIYERYKFYSCKQKDLQNLDQYITELKSLASSCEFKEEDNMVRDRIVMGVMSDRVREKLLKESGLNLKTAEDIARVYEVSRDQMQEMGREKQDKTIIVDKISTDYKSRANFKDKFTQNQIRCKKCDRAHVFNNCPAYGKLCNFCKKPNHFESCCYLKNKDKSQSTRNTNKQVKSVECDTDSISEMYIDTMLVDEIVNDGESEWFENVKINNHNFQFKLDTGAQCNILPAKYFAKCAEKGRLKRCNVKLYPYGGSPIPVRGSVKLICLVRGQVTKLEFIIVERGRQPILGLNSCLQLKLLKRVDSINNANKFENVSFKDKQDVLAKWKKCFDGLGTFPGKASNIRLRADAIPKVCPPRRIPRNLISQFKQSLDKLDKDGIIERTVEPTEWVNNIVITEKPNKKLRICLDPSYLNKCILREHYQLPTANEMLDDLAGKNIFSVLDLKDSFYQIRLDEDSSKLCTFATPFGRYRFKRVPFGLSTAAELFQRKNVEIFGDILGYKIYIDDLIIAGENESEHDRILHDVLETAQKAGITFNKDKFQFKQKKIKLLGFIVSSEGVAIDPGRVDSIVKMENPKNKKELLRFLGLVKYLGKFIPNLSTITAPLRELIKENVIWSWESIHSETVINLKKLLTTAPVLKHLDNVNELIIQTDSSKDGIGSCLLQDSRPVAFASRSATDEEKRYAPIERELGAIVFACEKFNYYIYGRPVVVQTDHKPLVGIFKKDINKVSSRLQRMMLRLMKYELDVQYVPGKEMYIADTLSRAFLRDRVVDDPEMSYVIHSVVKRLPVSEERKVEIKNLTKEDNTLKLVSEFINTGWPNEIKKVPIEVKPYWKIREFLCEYDGLIFFNDRLIIPSKFRGYILKILHETHLGIVKSKLKARECIYWPGMSQDIENLILNCEICEKFRPNNSKLPLLSYPITKRPWERIGMDIMEVESINYLVIVDYYSKWIEISKMKNKSISEVIKLLKPIFSIHGYPDIVIADNVPFNSVELKQYFSKCNVKLTNSSPNYPRSNGQAEKSVGIAKRIVRKSKESGCDISTHLLGYRNTPIPEIGLSPAQLLFNRRLKEALPVVEKLLLPGNVSKNYINNKFKQSQQKQKFYYNRNVKHLAEGMQGDNILFKCNDSWKQGNIVRSCDEPRSYIVSDDNNRLYRRSREHIIVKNDKQIDNATEAIQQPDMVAKEESLTNVQPLDDNVKQNHYNLRDRSTLKKRTSNNI